MGTKTLRPELTMNLMCYITACRVLYGPTDRLTVKRGRHDKLEMGPLNTKRTPATRSVLSKFELFMRHPNIKPFFAKTTNQSIRRYAHV